MTTAKEVMEDKRGLWHIARQKKQEINDQINALLDMLIVAKAAEHDAHEEYKEAKAIWRTGRAFNVTDARQAGMIHRLQDRGE